MKDVKGYDLLEVGKNRYDFMLNNGERKIVYEILSYNENEIEVVVNSVMVFAKIDTVEYKKEIIPLDEIKEIIKQ